MFLDAQQLNQHLTKNFSAVYWIQSNELFLLQEAVKKIRSNALERGYLENFREHTEDPGFEWDRFWQEIRQRSIFEDKKFIEIYTKKNSTFSQSVLKQLQAYSENPLPDVCLILISPLLEKKQLNNSLLQAIAKNIIIAQLWPPYPNQWQGWLKQRLSQHSLKLTPSALELLALFTEGNLAAAAQEIEKLSLHYSENKILDEAQILEALVAQNRYTLFNLSDAIVSKDIEKIRMICQNLSQSGTEIPLFIWLLAKDIRAMQQIKQGPNPKGILTRQISALKKLAEKHSPTALNQFLKNLAQLDQAIKTHQKNNAALIIERFCLTLSGVQIFCDRM